MVIVIDLPVLFDRIPRSQPVFYHYKRQTISVAQIVQYIPQPLWIDLPSPVRGFQIWVPDSAQDIALSALF